MAAAGRITQAAIGSGEHAGAVHARLMKDRGRIEQRKHNSPVRRIRNPVGHLFFREAFDEIAGFDADCGMMAVGDPDMRALADH